MIRRIEYEIVGKKIVGEETMSGYVKFTLDKRVEYRDGEKKHIRFSNFHPHNRCVEGDRIKIDNEITSKHDSTTTFRRHHGVLFITYSVENADLREELDKLSEENQEKDNANQLSVGLNIGLAALNVANVVRRKVAVGEKNAEIDQLNADLVYWQSVAAQRGGIINQLNANLVSWQDAVTQRDETIRQKDADIQQLKVDWGAKYAAQQWEISRLEGEKKILESSVFHWRNQHDQLKKILEEIVKEREILIESIKITSAYGAIPFSEEILTGLEDKLNNIRIIDKINYPHLGELIDIDGQFVQNLINFDKEHKRLESIILQLRTELEKGRDFLINDIRTTSNFDSIPFSEENLTSLGDKLNLIRIRDTEKSNYPHLKELIDIDKKLTQNLIKFDEKYKILKEAMLADELAQQAQVVVRRN